MFCEIKETDDLSFQGVSGKDEIVRGIFHRENRILLRKSNISDKDTIFNLTVIC